MKPATDPLRASMLETALLRALREAYSDCNASHFKRALRPAVIALGDGQGWLGKWQLPTRTLLLERGFAMGSPWGQVVEVMRHEMAHQYVAEVLGERDESAHGPSFRALCERLGIDGRAAGLPASARPEEEGRVLRRIAKLLALAESENIHEAELAMAEAQRLMLKHNLEVTPSGYGFAHLGRATGRVSEGERILAGILAEHFFVEVLWVPWWQAEEAKRGSILEVCGTPVNLELAAYVHAFLGDSAARLWAAHQRARGIRSNRDRRGFIAGVMTGFRDRLERERAGHQESGLMWTGDADLTRWFRRRHPRIRYTNHFAGPDSAARASGRAEGKGLVLHRPVAGGGASSDTRPRFLTGKST